MGEAAALEQNKIEAEQWEKETQIRLEKEENEKKIYEKSERERLEREQLEAEQWQKEMEEGEREMARIEEERRIEDELWEKQQRKEEEERLKKEELEALDVWDGPMGECVWNGEDELVHKGDALVFDNQCKVLAEIDCINGGPYDRCQWVGFS